MANNKKLYKEAVAVFGHARQAEMMVEECAELIQALQKFKRGEPNNTAEEVADVEIVCAQMRLIFPGVLEAKKEKLIRLQRLVDKKRIKLKT